MRGLTLLACVAWLAACGSAQETHKDANKPAPDTPALQLADGKAFGARFFWTNGPVVCDAEDKQSAGRLVLTTADEQIPATVDDVTVTPWMKIHGHGTGRWQPVVARRPNTVNEFDVTGLCFIMAGPWELNVEATVNGQRGQLEWPLEVP